jgi:hypothetical protein
VRDARVTREYVHGRLLGAGRADHVQLGAVARRQRDGLAHGAAAPQFGQDGAGPRVVEREPLAQCQRRRPVRRSDSDEARYLIDRRNATTLA